jgi:O-antigen ligase
MPKRAPSSNRPAHPASAEGPALPGHRPGARWFAPIFGGFLGLTLLKFVNPVVLEPLMPWPAGLGEWVFTAWPSAVAYALLGLVAVAGWAAGRGGFREQLRRMAWWGPLPGAWLVWQGVAALQSVDAELSRRTLWHFGACVACFYLGLLVASRAPNPRAFFWPVCVAFAGVLAVGWEQHFGGLERSREYFFTYLYGQMPGVPPEFLKRLTSGRIFANQFYPNALAGVVLMVLPLSVALIWQMERWFTRSARIFLAASAVLAALACLFWSGSKGGWLLMLVLGALTVWRLPLPKWVKRGGLIAGIAAGLIVFAVKYAGFFERGATSVGARFDYWQAALRTSLEKPVFGSGPGTFGVAYKAIKRPESEMSRLAHNDYLQQASDSGWVGFGLYATFLGVALWRTRPQTGASGPPEADSSLRFAVWLGVLAWALQGWIEFGLYLPSLAWCAFAWLGWLSGTVKRVDNRPTRA